MSVPKNIAQTLLEPLSRFVNDRQVTKDVSPEKVRARLAAAMTVRDEFMNAWKAAQVGTEAGADPGIENAAKAKALAAAEDVARLESILMSVINLQEERSRRAIRAKEDAEDAELIGAFDDIVDKAKALEPAATALIKAHDAYVTAAMRLRQLATVNPRARGGAWDQQFTALVSKEFARLCGGAKALLPGADRWAAASEDARAIPPLYVYLGEVAQAVRKGLNHGEA